MKKAKGETPNEDSEKEADAQESILIVANRPKTFESAANFLSRRGFPCSVMADIRQAIKIISDKKPTYVFLSWNLKNAKIIQTYSLLAKTFRATTIVFAELTDSKTAAELAQAGIPEIMQAPVSGPGMYMRIQRIAKAREESSHHHQASGHGSMMPSEVPANLEELPEEGAWESDGRDQGTGKTVWRFKRDQETSKTKKGSYTFKGEKPPTKDGSGKWKTDGEDGSLFFESAPKGPHPHSAREGTSHEEDLHLSEEEIEAIASRIAEGKTGEEESDGYGSIMKVGNRSREPKQGHFHQREEPKKDSGLMTFGLEKKSATDHVLQGEKKGSAEHHFSQEEANAPSFSATQEGLKSKEFETTTSAHEGAEFNLTSEGSQKSSSNQAFKKEPRESVLSGRDSSSILAKSAQKALQESVIPGQSNVEILETVERCHVFTIKSPRFQGFLVATRSGQGELDVTVLSNLKSKIEEHLGTSGEALSEFERLDCAIQTVNFQDWSKDAAEFTVVADHKNEQWALAFFPSKSVLPKIETTEVGQMLAVDVDDVLPEVKISFDLFIYLPVNSKHFLYVRRGQYLQKSQSGRMKDGSKTRFYIKEKDLQSFKEFCIANKLNAYVQEYHSKKQAS